MAFVMSQNTSRPLSPHLGVYRWGPAMAVSIVNRIVGNALATVGALILLWWLYAISSGPEQLAYLASWFDYYYIGYIVLVGLTWSFFQHLFGGIRHLVMDAGAGYELGTNKFWSIMTFVCAVCATALVWALIFSNMVEG